MTDLAEALLGWYGQAKRILPWRDRFDPYKVWVSEIMLQQTRVDTVIPYYERFMEAFPNVKALSEAEESVYLKLWEGLGYYSRVRNLVKGAKMVQDVYHGVIPETKKELMAIPGIGDYTASAILSFAFGERTVTVDGNLIRVYARLAGDAIVPNEESSKKACYDFFLPHIDESNSRDFNQALMDLGELVCLPNGNPKCLSCPLSKYCRAYKEGKQTSYPLPKKKIEKKIEHRVVFALLYRNKVALFKRTNKGLLSGMYEYLNVIDEDRLDPKLLLEKENIPCKSLISLGKAKHVFTHLVWEMEGYACVVDQPLEGVIFATKNDLLNTFALPNAFAYFTRILCDDYLK